ncbi:MAG: PqqD family protein, partial [Ilumatobacter sp.]|nr:PqqD family protein [Ilumatobacter sp.]
PVGVALIEQLAGRPDRSVDDIVADVASRHDTDPAHLQRLVRQLEDNGLLSADGVATAPPLTPGADAPTDHAAAPSIDPKAPLALRAPRVVVVDVDGFALLDHDGHVRLRLDAPGVLVLRALSERKSLLDANRHQRIAFGDNGISREDVERIVAVLAAHGELVPADVTGD